MHVGQLDGVADHLDLADEPADVASSRRPGSPRGRAPRPRTSGSARRRSRCAGRAAASRRPGSSRRAGTARAGPRAPRRCGRCTSARSPPSSSSLNITISPTRSYPRAATTFIASLTRTSWPGTSSPTPGATLHAQLATLGLDVDRAVVVAPEERREAVRRVREPVDLGLEGHDLVARLAQGVGQPPVGVGEPRSSASSAWMRRSTSRGHGLVGHGTPPCQVPRTLLRTAARACRDVSESAAAPGLRPVTWPDSAGGPGGGPGTVVVRPVGTSRRAGPLRGQDGAGSQPPAGQEESGVPGHPMVRADRQPLQVPGPQHAARCAAGSVNRPSARRVSAIRDSWVVVAT